MAQIASSVKKMHFLEIMLLLSVLVATMVRYVFGYQPTFFLEIFTLGLALVYFPFGFYFIGKPTEVYSNTISIILGFIYALGALSLLISEINIDSYRYPLIADFFVLVAVVIYLLFKMRSEEYPQTYVNAQFIRVAFFIVASLIVLLA
jgi:hypothetical protein